MPEQPAPLSEEDRQLLKRKWKALHLEWPGGEMWLCRSMGLGVQHGRLPTPPFVERELAGEEAGT